MSLKNRKPLRGSVLPLISVFLAVGAITIAGLASFGVSFTSWFSRNIVEPPTSFELAASLARVGISAESLAASGASDQEVTQLVTNARSHLDADGFVVLETADETFRQARATHSSLSSRISSGHGTQEDVVALRNAEQALTAAEAALNQRLSGLRSAAHAALSAGEQSTLDAIEANAGRALPVQYLVSDRTDAEWVLLRDALANHRISPRFDEEFDPDCSEFLQRCNADSDVAAAKSRVDSRLPQVTTAYELALGLRE